MDSSMGFQAYGISDESDSLSMGAEMQGPSSSVNQMVGKGSWTSSPTRSLVLLWFAVLFVYWMLGWLFRGKGK